MRLDLEYLTKIERFEEDETTDDCRYYRCLAHDLEVNSQFARFTPEGLAQLGETYANKALIWSHWNETFGWGKVLNGEMGDEGLYLKFMIIKDYNNHGIDSNSIIKSLDKGIIQYVSMGFGVSESTCSICGKSFGNFLKRECEHIRGRIYPIERNGVVVREPCIQIIRKSEAWELSLVFLGADRDARITNKQEMYSQSEVINNNNSGNSPKLFNLQPDPKEEEPIMSTPEVFEAEVKTYQAEIKACKAIIAEKEAKVTAAVADKLLAETKLDRQIEENTSLREHNRKVEVYKKDSELFRNRLTEELGVAYIAYDPIATEDDKKKVMSLADNLPTEEIVKRIDTYKGLIIEKTGAGQGRQTLTKEDDTTNSTNIPNPNAVVQGYN